MPQFDFVRQSVIVGPGPPATQLLQGRQSRLSIVLFNVTIGNVFFDYDPSLTALTAQFFLSPSPDRVLRYQDYGPLIQLPWYAINQGGISIVQVTEIFSLPN